MSVANKFLPICRRGNAAPCAKVCPFGLDVREFITKLQRGSFDGAFRLFRDKVIFPDIVSSLCGGYCMSACAEKNCWNSISIRRLEKTSMKLARSIDPPLLNLPVKDKSVTVIGAGISGLTCALRLASMNYQVTICERSDRIGGNLWNLLRADVFISDINRQFQHAKYKLVLRREIDDLSQIGRCNAIYVATGKEGKFFGLKTGTFGQLVYDTELGVICGGELTGVDILKAIVHGAQAATGIERFFKTGDFACDETNSPGFASCEKIDIYGGYAPDEKIYTREDAIAEAKRCSKCDCDYCYDSCLFMQYHRKYPERIAGDAYETINPATYIVQSLVATRMIASCSDCGLCGQRCPEDINMGKRLMLARQKLEEQGNLPPPFHAFHMRDFEFANSEQAALSMAAREGKNCRLMFFPGCQLGAVAPDLVQNAYAYLLEKEPSTGLLLRCCGVPAYWSGAITSFSDNLAVIRSEWERFGKPTIIVACPTCARMFHENLAELPIMSIYEMLDESIPSFRQNRTNETFSIFDPCASRYFPAMQKSIRNIMRLQKMAFHELPFHGADAVCCSWGGHMHLANPSLAQSIRERSVNLSGNAYITYCIVCREQFAAMGKDCRHILEFMFPDAKDEQPPVLLSKKFDNRIRLRRDLLANFWGAHSESTTTVEWQLIIPEELQKKMSEELIWVKDVREVISRAEYSGSKLYFPNSGNNLAHLKIGHITYWVEYRPQDGGYLLINAYSHRMALDKDTNDV
jgi:Fe-S oxidoreductase